MVENLRNKSIFNGGVMAIGQSIWNRILPITSHYSFKEHSTKNEGSSSQAHIMATNINYIVELGSKYDLLMREIYSPNGLMR
tara:strand:+ start:703 stop:948 length:246 start_codon:yes stop_codon:yes gene_type:complete